MRAPKHRLTRPFSRQFNAIGAIVYISAFATIKLSILLLYLRVFGITHRRTRVAVWIIIGLVTCIALSGIFGNLFLCNPVKKLFVYDLPGKCDFPAVIKLARAQSFMQVFTDVFITTVPIPMILKLKLPVAQKIGIMAIMATGLFVTVISIVPPELPSTQRPAPPRVSMWPANIPPPSGPFSRSIWL